MRDAAASKRIACRRARWFSHATNDTCERSIGIKAASVTAPMLKVHKRDEMVRWTAGNRTFAGSVND